MFGSEDVGAEHHAVVRRMRDRELHVRRTHALERAQSASAVLPRAGRFLAQDPEPLGGHRGEERRFVGEMPIERRSRYTERAADAAQGQPVDAVSLNRPHRRLQQGVAEVAVMVPVGAFSGRFCHGRAGHWVSLRAHVDRVNISALWSC